MKYKHRAYGPVIRMTAHDPCKQALADSVETVYNYWHEHVQARAMEAIFRPNPMFEILNDDTIWILPGESWSTRKMSPLEGNMVKITGLGTGPKKEDNMYAITISPGQRGWAVKAGCHRYYWGEDEKDRLLTEICDWLADPTGCEKKWIGRAEKQNRSVTVDEAPPTLEQMRARYASGDQCEDQCEGQCDPPEDF